MRTLLHIPSILIYLHRAAKKSEETTKYTEAPSENWRDKWWVDGVWLKWIVERLENQEQIDYYNNLKDRMYNRRGYTDLTESWMLRFLTGLGFDIDTAEENLWYHHNYMLENNVYEISDDRISNMKPENILICYGEDKYERPISYMRVGRFYPSKNDFTEIRDYLFWNVMNIRNAFKPHVESFIAIYDVKGLSKKNFSMDFFK